MLRSRRFAFAAAAVLLGLSACGDAGSTTTGGSTPAVIHIGAAGNAGGAKIAASEASDRMIMPMQDITYVYDGEFPDLGSTGPAWTLPVGGEIDEARVAEMAKLFGVEGDVRALPAEQGGGYMVGAEDFSTANLTVSADGMLTWWFSPAPSADPGVACAYAGSEGGGAVPAVAPDAPTDTAVTDVVVPDTVVPVPMPVCEEPQPPTGVPSEADALATAKTLFTELGYDLAQFEFDAYADEWGANVTAYRMLGGHRSPLQMNVGFGENGSLTWASGVMAEPQPAADYPLVSGEEAIQRLNDESGRWSWYPGYGAMAKGGVALDATTAIATREVSVTETAMPSPVPAPAPDDSVTDDPQVIDPIPVDSLPPLEPITVHLDGVRLDLTMIWAEDGTVWLLPAYTFTGTDGGEYTVIAIDDSFIQTPDPAPAETTPVETVPVETAPAGTIPVDPAPAETTAPALIVDQASEALVGLTVDEATKVAEGNGWSVRVVTLDGVDQVVTDDFRSNRANVAVENGVVVSVTGIF